MTASIQHAFRSFSIDDQPFRSLWPGDLHHVPPCILTIVRLSASVNRFAPSYIISISNIFPRFFPLMQFPSSILVVTWCSLFSLFITWPEWVAWLYCIFVLSDLVVLSSYTTVSFDYFSGSMRVIAFLSGVAFLLPPVSFIAVLKLFRPQIRMGPL